MPFFCGDCGSPAKKSPLWRTLSQQKRRRRYDAGGAENQRSGGLLVQEITIYRGQQTARPADCRTGASHRRRWSRDDARVAWLVRTFARRCARRAAECADLRSDSIDVADLDPVQRAVIRSSSAVLRIALL